MVSYIPVVGTHGHRRQNDWDASDSPFNKFLQERDIQLLVSDPIRKYAWSSMLDGLDNSHDTWDASGRALFHYIVPPLGSGPAIPPKDTYIISHSHGGNVVAYACGKYGLKIEGLITVGTPVRKDLEDLYAQATMNITRHLHLHSGWKDFWQIFGAVFDGRIGIHREHPYATNDKTPGGHGAILRDLKHFPLWLERGWLDFWLGKSEPI